MNIKQLSSELNVDSTTIIRYARVLRLSIVTLNQQLADDEIQRIKQVHFQPSAFDFTDFFNPLNDLSSSNLLSEFQMDNHFENNIIELVQNDDSFLKRNSKRLLIGNKKIETIFSDFEAASICGGLEDPRSRLLSRLFFKGQCTESDLVELHAIANTAFDKYGNLLSFVMTLPQLPFTTFDSTPIFSELDIRKNTNKSPILRISFLNQHGNAEKIQLSFYAENLDGTRQRNEHFIIVKNQTRNETIMKISRDNKIVPQNSAKSIIPILQLFVRFSKDTKSMIINYGLETGECSICGRELTDKESIKRGIGPICAKY